MWLMFLGAVEVRLCLVFECRQLKCQYYRLFSYVYLLLLHNRKLQKTTAARKMGSGLCPSQSFTDVIAWHDL